MTPGQANGPPLETQIAFKLRAQYKSLAYDSNLASSAASCQAFHFKISGNGLRVPGGRRVPALARQARYPGPGA
jgi:hypothetical protein